MAYSLLDGGRVTPANAPAFLAVLEAGVDRARVRDRAYRVAYSKLYGAAVAKAHLFPPEAQLAIRRWELQVLAQLELCTDDTFIFNRAAKAVRDGLRGLPCIYPALEPEGGATHYSPSERAGWAPVLFECVQTAMGSHKHLWARTTCDMLVKEVVDRRQNFTDEQQVWNT